MFPLQLCEALASSAEPNVTPRRIVSLVSLGCPKNLVDSEGLVSALLSNDFRLVTDPKDSEVVIVNTCGFLDASRQESLAQIRDVCQLKKTNQVRGVLVAGCMVGNYRELLATEAPDVDGLVGFGDYPRIAQIVEGLLPRSEAPTFTIERRRVEASLTPRHYAYLKISEGCNHVCTFCVIPSIRGPMRSLPIEDLVGRARAQAERGVRELNLIAQDSTVYGGDIYGEVRLERLISRLAQIDGIAWIRLMYAYPTEVRDALIDLLGSGGAVLPYLDVPIQHAATGVLARMKRGYDRRTLDRMVDKLRARGVAIRTTVIVGFPGETAADFEELLQFLRDARFDRLGAFRYSREEGSAAADLDGQVPEPEKDERWNRLMALQQEIAFANARARIGTVEDVLIDVPAADGRPARGRTRWDAPEVDASVFVEGDGLAAGNIVPVHVAEARGYDLAGRANPTSALRGGDAGGTSERIRRARPGS